MRSPRKSVGLSKSKRVLAGLAVISAAILTLGSDVKTEPAFVAIAPSLAPTSAPIQAEAESKPAAIVETRVEYVAAAPVASSSPAVTTVSGSSYGGVAGFEQCTDFVERVLGVRQNGNAGSWISNSSTPRAGAVMIFAPGEQGAAGIGHVAVVRSVNGSSILIQESNFGAGNGSYRTVSDNGRYWIP